MEFTIIKIFFLTAVSFIVTILWTPLLTHVLYRYRLGKQIRDVGSAPIYFELHKQKSGTPTMGGLLIWVTTVIFALAFAILAKVVPEGFWHDLSFLTRSQTFLPLGMFILAALVGFVDDLYNIQRRGRHGGGFSVREKLLLYAILALVGAWWFYFKLDWTTLHVPFIGNFDIGGWYVPIFLFVIVATAHSVNLSDGLDGLAGGLLLASFSAYAAIAFAQGKYELAALCGVIIGALLAFLWFNISPARFFMGDTGAMGMGVTLGILAMLTNTAFLLPIIGFLFVLESLSVIIQLLSKRFRGKKVFLSSPLHHHLEAKGWPETKIVMRFWIVSAVLAVIGVILALVDRA